MALKKHQSSHPFDMSDFYSGLIFEVGGKTFDGEDRVKKTPILVEASKKTVEKDWTFLKNLLESLSTQNQKKIKSF
jgi:hypothetical protein